MRIGVTVGMLGVLVLLSRSSVPALAPATAAAATAKDSVLVDEPGTRSTGIRVAGATEQAVSTAAPMTVLMRSGTWFVYSHGCDTVQTRRDVVIHFHGAHTTVIPRYLASGLDAVLVIVNLGLFSGPYTAAFGIRANVDGLLDRIQKTIAEQCQLEDASITRLALSSWSAGYGATEQFLRWRSARVDAVLLADGLHVGFSNRRTRTVNVDRLDVFLKFARMAAQREKLMSITHSSILPVDYAGAGETALALSESIQAPTSVVHSNKYGMLQISTARRGNFYVEGFAGNDKPAHAKHLYSIGKTSFARLREHWMR